MLVYTEYILHLKIQKWVQNLNSWILLTDPCMVQTWIKYSWPCILLKGKRRSVLEFPTKANKQTKYLLRMNNRGSNCILHINTIFYKQNQCINSKFTDCISFENQPLLTLSTSIYQQFSKKWGCLTPNPLAQYTPAE